MAIAPASPNGTGSASSTGSTTITFTRPSGWTSGRVAIMSITVKGGSNITIAPTGSATFTTVNVVEHGSNFALFTCRRVLGGSEPASYTWNITTKAGAASSRDYTAVGAAFTGMNTSTPVDGAGAGQANSFSTNCTAPTISPGLDTPYEAVTWIGGHNRGFTPASGNVTAPSGYTLLVDARSGTGTNNTSAAIAWRSTSATTGTAVGVWSSAANNAGQHLGLVAAGQNLAGQITGVASVSATLLVERNLVAHVAATHANLAGSSVSTAAGAPTITRPLVATVAGESSVSATLTNVQAPWTASVVSVSTVSAALTVQFGSILHQLVATVAGTSVLAATGPTMGLALEATVAGAATVTADLSLESTTLAPTRGRSGGTTGRTSSGGAAPGARTGGRRD